MKKIIGSMSKWYLDILGCIKCITNINFICSFCLLFTSWSLIALQCAVSFCCTVKRVSYMHTYVYTHTYTYTRTHTRTHVHTRICAHMHTHKAHMCTHVHTHACACIHMHTCTRAHTHVYTCLHIHTHTCTYTHTFIHTSTHTYVHMHTYAYTCIHMHTHTYIYLCSLLGLPPLPTLPTNVITETELRSLRCTAGSYELSVVALCFVLFFLAMPHGTQGLSSPTKDRICAPCRRSIES